MRFSFIFLAELEDAVKTHNLPSNYHIYNIFFKINSQSTSMCTKKISLSAANAVRFRGDTYLLLAMKFR